MPTNRIRHLGAVGLVVLVVTVGLAATPRAASTPSAESRPAVNAAQASAKIAFLRANELYVVNADGSEPRMLTPNARPATPAWSPDGRRIAFVTNRDGNPEVYVMNADGSEQQNLTRYPARDGGPAWSPDGRKIVFERWVDRHREVYVMNADGSGQRNLTGDPANDVHPVWSPDGRKIGFVRRIGFVGPPRPGGAPGFRILFRNYLYVVNVDGSGQRKPRNIPMTGAWSPDGRKIAFRGAFPRGSWGSPRANYDLYVMNADGSGQRRLTRSPSYDGDPVWSLDGRLIAFRSTRDGNAEIYVMNADGSGQRRLTRSPEYERCLLGRQHRSDEEAAMKSRISTISEGMPLQGRRYGGDRHV